MEAAKGLSPCGASPSAGAAADAASHPGHWGMPPPPPQGGVAEQTSESAAVSALSGPGRRASAAKSAVRLSVCWRRVPSAGAASPLQFLALRDESLRFSFILESSRPLFLPMLLLLPLFPVLAAKHTDAWLSRPAAYGSSFLPPGPRVRFPSFLLVWSRPGRFTLPQLLTHWPTVAVGASPEFLILLFRLSSLQTPVKTLHSFFFSAKILHRVFDFLDHINHGYFKLRVYNCKIQVICVSVSLSVFSLDSASHFAWRLLMESEALWTTCCRGSGWRHIPPGSVCFIL